MCVATWVVIERDLVITPLRMLLVEWSILDWCWFVCSTTLWSLASGAAKAIDALHTRRYTRLWLEIIRLLALHHASHSLATSVSLWGLDTLAYQITGGSILQGLTKWSLTDANIHIVHLPIWRVRWAFNSITSCPSWGHTAFHRGEILRYRSANGSL